MRNLIKQGAKALGVELRHFPLFRRAIHILTRTGPKPFFVQIGANNGIDYDDFFSVVSAYDLPGIAVEPIPYYFETLAQAYKRHPQIITANVALHPTSSAATIYRADPAKITTGWHHAIGSFSRDHLTKWGVTEDAIIAEVVPCLTFDALLAAHMPADRGVDILFTDTEGFDAEILGMVDLSHHKPKVIKYESKHLSPKTAKSLADRLIAAGYHLEAGPEDTVAVRPDLASRWAYFRA